MRGRLYIKYLDFKTAVLSFIDACFFLYLYLI